MIKDISFVLSIGYYSTLKLSKMKTFQNLFNQALDAGFEDYCNTYKQDFPNPPVFGNILTNTKVDSPYNGEVLEIYEDGTYQHYGQFKQMPVNFKFK